MLNPNVARYLNDKRPRHLAKLKELLRIPSQANNQPQACEDAAQWLRRELEAMGVPARVIATPGRPNVLAELHVSDAAPALLVYGHYDVQPPDPLDLWKTPPFEPTERDGFLYARGASDDKGQLFTHLMAIEAWQKAGGGLPVNLKILLEGEEEVGSPNLEPFLAEHAGELAADAAVISDSAFFAEGVPSLTYSLRGLAYFEITFIGPDHDLHSGINGGAVRNPINALAAMVAHLHDDHGRVMIPGFYDDVLPVSDADRHAWRQLPFDEAEYAASLGLDALSGGEKGLTALERIWGRPTLDCNGIVGGYTGPGSKTVIPARASTKISTRLVPNQDPARIVAGMKKFVADHTPAGIRSEVAVYAQARAVLLNRDGAAMRSAQAAVAEAFGRDPVFVRCGASIPVTELFQRLLGMDVVLLDIGLPEDNLHAPNERFSLEHLYRGAVASAAFMQNFAGSKK